MSIRRAGLRLVPSALMGPNKRTEQDKIRIPKFARDFLGVASGDFNLAVSGEVIKLQIRTAYKADANKLIRAVKKGAITEADANVTCFICPELFKRVKPSLNGDFVSTDIEHLKVGGDPEFVLVNPSDLKFKYADHVQGLTKTGQLGCDGPLAEVRPPPSDTAGGFVDNIGEVFRKFRKSVEHYHWRSGASYKSPNHTEGERVVAVGGHLQFGDPIGLPKDLRATIYKQTVRILDETVGLALVRIDTPIPEHRRNSKWHGYGPYGCWGDHKDKGNRVEWRVPSGLWLTHPTMARAVVGTTRAVVASCYQEMADRGYARAWITSRADRPGFLKHMKAEGVDKVKSLINNARADSVDAACLDTVATKLRNLCYYGEHSAEIEEFISLVNMSDKDRLNINLDTKNNWLGKGPLFKG